MAFARQGINTGLLGYTLKKEFLADAICFRETQTFSYELYAADMQNLSPSGIHTTLYNDFRNRFSGDIFVKVFEVPAEYNFPNDHVHVAKYKASVEVKSSPAALFTNQLTGAYYSGIDVSLWQAYGPSLLDFKEDFDFAQEENGDKVYSHNLSFSLITGNRATAVNIASGVFARDKDTSFGITALVGGVGLADTTVFLDFYNEVYDEIRQSYKFTKRRTIPTYSGTSGVYSMNHTLDFKEDGTFDITEKAEVVGKLNFSQSQGTLDSLYANAYSRCNSFYNTYSSVGGSGASTTTLATAPTKSVKSYNRKAMSSEYTVSFTTNPNFKSDGTSIDEVFDLTVNELNFADLKHRLSFSANRRTATTSFITLLTNATGYSPSRASGYYQQSNGLYNSALPLNQIRYELTWPSRSHNATAEFDYSNNPRYFPTINGVTFKSLDIKVQNTRPVDIVNEYKVINRPTKFSVINYAYQTEKGQLSVTLEAGLGRNPSEFVTGFRSNYGSALNALYRHGISIFMGQFLNVIPRAFTYFLSDMKYTLNEEGMLTVVLTFNYTLKKYVL